MEAYQQRVVDEFVALREKRELLEVFMTSKIFSGLPNDEQLRMGRQLYHMTGYAEVLGERIAAFGK